MALYRRHSRLLKTQETMIIATLTTAFDRIEEESPLFFSLNTLDVLVSGTEIHFKYDNSVVATWKYDPTVYPITKQHLTPLKTPATSPLVVVAAARPTHKRPRTDGVAAVASSYDELTVEELQAKETFFFEEWKKVHLMLINR